MCIRDRNKGEVWGRIDEDEEHPEKPPVAVINKDVLCEFLEKTGFDYAAISKNCLLYTSRCV